MSDTELEFLEDALGVIMPALAIACAVACLISLASASWWAPVLGGASCLCIEAHWRLRERRRSE